MKSKSLSAAILSRREAILRFGHLLGGGIVGGPALIAGCASIDSRPVGELFSGDDLAMLDEIADTILPETATPGAKAAEVGAFIAVMVADTYTASEQAVFSAGLLAVDSECRRDHGVGFTEATETQRTRLLERLDREQFDTMNSRSPGSPVHYFRMIKELTLTGYFTSEIGYTRAMRYVESPGRFDPCVPYSPGDRAWAPHA